MVINVYRVPCACCFTSVISFNLPSMPVITINVIILTLQVRELRLREGKRGAQGHTASRGHMGLSLQVCLTPQARLAVPCCAAGCLGCPLGAESSQMADTPKCVRVCHRGGQCRLNRSYHGLFTPIRTCILPCVLTYACKYMCMQGFYSRVCSHTHTPGGRDT